MLLDSSWEKKPPVTKKGRLILPLLHIQDLPLPPPFAPVICLCLGGKLLWSSCFPFESSVVGKDPFLRPVETPLLRDAFLERPFLLNVSYSDLLKEVSPPSVAGDRESFFSFLRVTGGDFFGVLVPSPPWT